MSSNLFILIFGVEFCFSQGCSLRRGGWESSDGGVTRSAEGKWDALETIPLCSSLLGISPPLFFSLRNLSFLREIFSES